MWEKGVHVREKKPFDPEESAQAYAKMRPAYVAFTEKLYGLINDLLETHNIDVAQIEHRTKTVDSFREKITRSGKTYEKPLVQVNDLSGIRIIAYYLEDVERLGAMLREEFEIDEASSVDKAEAADPDRFGYLSVHYGISLSASRKKLTEWKHCAALKAEVQIRTALQHAWSVIDHKLRYKAVNEVPRSLRRQLFRLSALLELADSEFSNLRKRSDKLDEQYSDDVGRGEYDIELNMVSLEAYLKTSQQHKEWAKIAVEVGFESLGGKFEKTLWLRLLGDMLKTLQKFGIKTISDFNAILEEARKWGRDVLALVCKASKGRGYTPIAVSPHVLMIIVIYGLRKSMTRQDVPFRRELKESIVEIAEIAES